MRSLSVSRLRWLKGLSALTLVLVMVGALGIAGAVPSTGPTELKPDAYEFDNNANSAKPIEVNGSPQQHTLSTLDDIDYVKFGANSGSTYVINATDPNLQNVMPVGSAASGFKASQIGGFAGAMVVLELWDSEGNMVFTTRERMRDVLWLYLGSVMRSGAKSAGAIAIPDYFSKIVWKAPKSGTYYVRVVPFTLAAELGLGEYNLNVQNVAASITGNVTYADTGKPAPYTLVFAEPWGPRTASSKTVMPSNMTMTDGNGNYILYNLEQGIDHQIYFDQLYDDYYQPEWYNNVHQGDSQEATKVFLGTADPVNGINAAMDLYAPSIQGRVVDENGKPCVGVHVQADALVPAPAPAPAAQWLDTTAWTLTDSNGNYYLRNLAPKTWSVHFEDSDNDGPARYVEEWWDDKKAQADATTITVDINQVAAGSYDATLTEIPIVASGTIKNSAGEPVPYTDVDLYIEDLEQGVSAQVSDNYSWYWSTETNSKGYWEYREFELAGNFKALAEPTETDSYSRYKDQWFRGQSILPNDPDSYDAARAAATPFAAQSGTPATGINFTLEDVLPFVSGRVTDAITGAPLAGIEVWAYRWSDDGMMFLNKTGSRGFGEWVAFKMATTDAGGNYRFQQLWAGSGEMDIELGFFDKSGIYATEYWDDKQTLMAGNRFSTGYLSNDIANAALMPKPGRLYGPTRYSTAAAIALSRFPNWAGVQNVVIASGDDAASADPLTAASLCWAYDAPLLLTSTRDANAQDALNAIKAINAKNGGTTKIIVVGGLSSVPQARINEFAAVIGAANIDRLPGGDRYETAYQVALRGRLVATAAGKTLPDFAIVANGADPEKFGDALSASAVSGAKGAPILLVHKDSVPAPTTSALAAIKPASVYVAGGTASVSNAVYGAVSGSQRMWGANRYSTSVAIAQTAFDKAWLNVEEIGVAARIPDALTGGVDMGAMNGPLLVVKKATLPSETQAFVLKYKQIINDVVVFGGPDSISGNVKIQIDQTLAQ